MSVFDGPITLAKALNEGLRKSMEDDPRSSS